MSNAILPFFICLGHGPGREEWHNQGGKGMAASKVTEIHKRSLEKGIPELLPRQEQAIILLAAGKTHSEVAATLGLARETVSKWNSRDPRFIARLNQVKNEMTEKMQSKLEKLVTTALDSLEKGIRDDPRLALEFLKHAKAFTAFTLTKPSGETDPEKILGEMAIKEAKVAYKAKRPDELTLAFPTSEEEMHEMNILRKKARKEILEEVESTRRRTPIPASVGMA